MNKKIDEVQSILKDIDFLKSVYLKLLEILPSFNVTDKKVLPYGLKPHTRSVSWLVEQVITQQTKYRAKEIGLSNVDFSMPDTCLHDCEITANKEKYFVNIKIHNIDGKENKNDISAVEKLYLQYLANHSYRLVYVCLGIKFQDIKIIFDKSYIQVFSPQFLPIYVNPRNDKIQALYKHKPIKRTRKEFLKLLQKNSKSIVLK